MYEEDGFSFKCKPQGTFPFLLLRNGLQPLIEYYIVFLKLSTI